MELVCCCCFVSENIGLDNGNNRRSTSVWEGFGVGNEQEHDGMSRKVGAVVCGEQHRECGAEKSVISIGYREARLPSTEGFVTK